MPLPWLLFFYGILKSAEADSVKNILLYPDTSNYDNAQMGTLKYFRKMVLEKCGRLGFWAAYSAKSAVKTALNVETCDIFSVDIDTFKDEIDNSIKARDGSLPDVFIRYCRSNSTTQACIVNMLKAFDLCLEEEEKVTLSHFINATSFLFKYICHRDGDNIALFIAEDGLECLNVTTPAVNKCFSATYKDSLPRLEFSSKESKRQFDELRYCLLEEIKLHEACKNSANFIDSLYELFRKSIFVQSKTR